MVTLSVRFTRALIALAGASILLLNGGCQSVPPEALPLSYAPIPPRFDWAKDDSVRGSWADAVRQPLPSDALASRARQTSPASLPGFITPPAPQPPEMTLAPVPASGTPLAGEAELPPISSAPHSSGMVMMIIYDPMAASAVQPAPSRERASIADPREPRTMASADSIQSIPEFSRYFEVVPDR